MTLSTDSWSWLPVTEKYQPQVPQGPEMEPIGSVMVALADRPGRAYMPIDRCTRCQAIVPTEHSKSHQEWHTNLQGWREDLQKLLHMLNDRIPNA